MIELSCHCGEIKITAPASTKTVTSCNCSICRRYASLWAYFAPEDVIVKAEKKNIGSYSWGDKMINFHHCKRCGCITHYTQVDPQGRMAVNFRLVEQKIVEAFDVRYFDGADTWTEIKPTSAN